MTRAGGPASIERWVAEPLKPDVAKALDRLAATEDVVQVAVLPDVHLAKDVCVGVALATETLLYPAAVGGDIGCGMAAVRFDCDSELLSERKAAASLMANLCRSVPVTKHAAAGSDSSTHWESKARALSHPSLKKRLQREGDLQLGTLGRGNHFIEFQADEDERLWLMVHSGSRAMGQAIQAHHLKNARRSPTKLASLHADRPDGTAYLNDMTWALDYAAANRAAMVAAVIEIMEREFGVQADPATFVGCHHNFVDREEIGGRPLWIHRKGVISARRGEPGLVPGSMGAASFHVEGRGCERSLCSSSHGAGRAMSRSQARRSISVGALKKQLRYVWFDDRMAARLVDEAPSAYKDISAVMRAQKPLTRIVRRLRPLLCYKGA